MTHQMQTRTKTKKDLEKEQREEDEQQERVEVIQERTEESSSDSGNTVVVHALEHTEDNIEEQEQSEEEQNEDLEEMDMQTFMRRMFKNFNDIKKLMKKYNEDIMNMDKKIHRRLNTLENNTDRKKITTISLIENNKQELENKIEEVGNNVQITDKRIVQGEVDVMKILKENIDEKLGETKNELEKNVENKVEEETKKIKEIYDRVPMIGRWNIGCGDGSNTLKFSGYIKILHPVVFIKSIKNKTRMINNFEDVKEIIRHNLVDTALVWFTSVEENIKNFEEFQKKFLEYFWGEDAQDMFREKLYFGKFNYRINNVYVIYALCLNLRNDSDENLRKNYRRNEETSSLSEEDEM